MSYSIVQTVSNGSPGTNNSVTISSSGSGNFLVAINCSDSSAVPTSV